MVVNGAVPLSRGLGERYREARGVPAGNVVALDLPVTDPSLATNAHESVSREEFVRLVREPLLAALEARGLRERVTVLVTVKGLPLRVRAATAPGAEILRNDTGASLEAELALLGSGADGSAGVEGSRNPYFRSALPFAEFRARHPESPLRYLVARLDGPPLPLDGGTGLPAAVVGLIARGRAPALRGLTVVDEHPLLDPGLDAANRFWLRPATALLRAAGVPVLEDREPEMVAGARRIGAYVSWGSNDPGRGPAPFYGDLSFPEGRRARIPGDFADGAVSLDLVSTNARSFAQDVTYGQSLVSDLVRLGVAGAAGHVSEPVLLAVARPQVLLPSLARGVPAAEAFFRSLPFLGWQNVWIGDPLLHREAASATPADSDGDGVPDASDACTEIPDPAQRDSDGDGYGNVCDADLDGDGLVTTRWAEGAARGQVGDLERIAAAAATGAYAPEADLDGDGLVDARDLALAQLSLFQAPGPSGRATRRGASPRSARPPRDARRSRGSRRAPARCRRRWRGRAPCLPPATSS